jgi:peptidoglycan/xylan/chitin deacetylase (PgdA/CDA1 family)
VRPVVLGRAGAGLTGAALAAYWLPAGAALWTPLAHSLGVRTTVDAARGVALTFDDGPHPEGTPAVLEALARHGARATFFLVGEQVERWPELAAEIVTAGHAVGVHCQRHRNLLRLGPREVREDLDRATAVIAEGTGTAPRLYRPPYGILNGAALRHSRRIGWAPLLWSRHAADWRRRATPGSIAERLTEGVRPGEVLLLHDADWYGTPGSWRKTASAILPVMAELDRLGLEPVLA